MMRQRVELRRVIDERLHNHHAGIFGAVGHPAYHLEAHFGRGTLVAFFAIELEDSRRTLTRFQPTQDSGCRQRLLGDAIIINEVVDTHVPV